MLSIGKLTAGTEDYYLGQVVDGREEYYTDAGEQPGTWVGDGSRDLGLTGAVEPSALRAVLAGLEPTAGTPLAGSVRRVPGFDLTFSAPKSVSLLHAFGSGEVRREVVEAHDRRSPATIEHLDARPAPCGGPRRERRASGQWVRGGGVPSSHQPSR